MTASLRIEIFPADLERSITFYETLGFTLLRRDAGPPPYAYLGLGDVRIGAVQSPAADPASRALPLGAEIVIEVDGIHAVHDHVSQAGLQVSTGLQEHPWGTY